MANKITGTTDTSGAISVSSKSEKSVMIVGVVTGAPTITPVFNTPFSIGGTADAKARYGENSPIVNMVKILIANRVSLMSGVIVATEGILADNYAAALDSTMGDKTIKCILLDTNDIAVVTELKSFLTVCESEDLFRYSVIAPPSNTTSQSALISFANSIGSDRIFIPGPHMVDADGVAQSPVYVMAGLTAVIMTETSRDPALPVNGVTISNIGSVGRVVLESERAILANNGITVLYNEAGLPTIGRLVTSHTTSDVWKEGTTRFIADHVLETVEDILRAKYKRTKNVERIINSIKTDINGVLENLNALEIIENFDPTTLSVVKDPSDTYGALVDYEFDVVTPLYTIKITQHMKI